MSPGRFWLSLRGLRPRMTLLLMAGVLFAGVGFEVLLVSVTRHSEYQQLESRTRAVARFMAERSVTPVVVGDRAELLRQVHRAITEPDVVGAAIHGAQGPALAQRSRQAGLWTDLGPLRARGVAGPAAVTRRRTADGEVVEAVAPLLHGPEHAGSLAEASQLFGFSDTQGRQASRPLGWVRLVASTERAEATAQEAARLGLILLLLTSVLALFGVTHYVGFVIRPLREAGGLAREIAAGQLDRRLPVRGADELGDLAGSMNSMAAALQEARRKAEEEAEAVRIASAAMLSIARGVRTAQDAPSVFAMVAHEVGRVAHARAVALAVPPQDQTVPVFEHFAPPAPWATLDHGAVLPQQLLAGLQDMEGGALRLPVAPGSGCSLREGLAADGLRTVLLVPLQMQDAAAPAVLLAASDDPEAFPASERDVVMALTSHLSSALRAQRLEARLEQTFEELQHTHDYLVHTEMLRVAGEMASGAAHDFNNVLGAILGRAQLIARRLEAGKLSSEELLTSLAVIERAAQDGRETGRRLRQFGQASQSAPVAPVDLHAVIRDAMEFTRPRWENEAQARGLAIEVRLESEPGAWVTGRAGELREVFTNLILNAIDALPRGGTIRLATRSDGSRAEASVADDGVGMDDETARRLFEPFFTTKGDRGTGLGMAVVYGIVQRHGGTAEVFSRPGEGTRMMLTFPRGAAPTDHRQPEAAAGELPALDVLVVDDEEPVRDVLRDVALAFGQRVTACGSGEEALAAFRPGGHQLVLMDLGMPGMTGWELARRVRDLDPAVTIAFVTGWGEDVDPRAASGAGADLVLAKPFDVEDVERALRLAAERAETRKAA